MRLIFLICAIALAGCSTPGSVSTSTSQFDNVREVAVNPGWLYNGTFGASMRMGIHWNTKMGDTAIITAYYIGADSFRSLGFNVDGEITTLKPLDAATAYEQNPGGTSLASVQRFEVPLAFVEKIVAAKKVILRYDLSKTFVDGEFREGLTMAKPAFRKFIAQVNAAKK